jgi:hypothetical protein
MISKFGVFYKLLSAVISCGEWAVVRGYMRCSAALSVLVRALAVLGQQKSFCLLAFMCLLNDKNRIILGLLCTVAYRHSAQRHHAKAKESQQHWIQLILCARAGDERTLLRITNKPASTPWRHRSSPSALQQLPRYQGAHEAWCIADEGGGERA